MSNTFSAFLKASEADCLSPAVIADVTAFTAVLVSALCELFKEFLLGFCLALFKADLILNFSLLAIYLS